LTEHEWFVKPKSSCGSGRQTVEIPHSGECSDDGQIPVLFALRSLLKSVLAKVLLDFTCVLL